MNSAVSPLPSPADSLGRLKAEVLDPGLCVACGACLGLCPHMIFYDGRLAAPDPCGLEDGRCYDLCPQVLEPEPDQRRRALHQALGNEFQPPLGPVGERWQARARRPDQGVQYGGVVSALVALALEEGLVGEAVLTRPAEYGSPRGVRVRDRQGVEQCTGSWYAPGAALGELNRALAEPAEHRLALVGLPCQALGAAAMKAHPSYPAAAQRLGLVIGLFCTWNLEARSLRQLLARQGVVGTVRRMDIPPPPAEVLQVDSDQGSWQLPLEKVRQVGLAGCALCPDMTAELADLSVGAAEGRPGWNTLLVRTPAGAELLELARQKELLELEEVAEASWGHLRQAAEGKRRRALAAWKERRHA